MTPRQRSAALVLFVTLLAASASASFCVPGAKPAQPAPPEPPPPVCEPKKCDRCSKSPCYLATGAYVEDYVDLQITSAGIYPITVSRRYDSSRPADGALGIGWSSSLTAHLYYATYLIASPSTYSYEADVLLPDGATYRFTVGANGTFTPPFGRYDALIRNADGTYALTPQHTRAVYRFGADGSLTSFTDDYGNALSYSYSGGRLQRIADSAGSGRYIDVTWGPDGRVASVTDSGGRVLKYFYDGTTGTLNAYSNVLASGDASQRTRYYTYVAGRFSPVLLRIEDRWHRVVTELDWYSDGRLKSYTEGRFNTADPPSSEGERFTYTYAPGPSGGQVTKTNSLGARTYVYADSGLVNDTATFNALGQLTSTDSGVGIRHFEYDGNGNVARMTDDAATWYYTYDVNFPNSVTSIIPKDNNGLPRTDWAGRAYDYVPAGNTAAGALAATYRIRSDTTTKDRTAAYTYDAHGRVTSVTDDANVLTAIYSYTAAGDLASVTRGSNVTTYSYDALGRRVAVTTPDGQTTTTAYDTLNRPITITLPKPTPSSPLNFVRTFTYDAYDSATGLVFTSVTDPNGRSRKTGADALGNIDLLIETTGEVTRNIYQYGLLHKVIDANGNETTYSYDSNRELSKMTFPDGTFETYSMANGRLFSKTDRTGRTMNQTYDYLGRLVRVTYSGLFDPYGGFVGYSYGYRGQNLADISDQQPGSRTLYQLTYDSSWRIISENIPGAETTSYTYLTGPPSASTWASSKPISYTIAPAAGTSGTTQTVSYGYDALGRVAGLTWSWAPDHPFLFSYHPNGQYSTITFPNGQSRAYAYDNQGRLTNVTNRDISGSALASFDYGYDYDWTSSTYTMLGQRSSMTISAPPQANLETGLTTYQYDARYQLVRTDHPTSPYETWTYDAIGNRTSSRTASYIYYKNGSNPLNGQRLRSAGGSPDMVYDAAGNLKGYVNSPNMYTWDYSNRLAAAPGVAYTYDYAGARRSSTSSTTTRFITHGPNTVGERNTTLGVATDYVFAPGIGEPLAKRRTNGSIFYYGADGLGSIALVTDTNGSVSTASTFDSWGVRGVNSDELFGFAGGEASGLLWFFRARYYDPFLGRFLSEDPIQRPDLNAYAYAYNDPVLLRDPLGLDAGGARQGPVSCVVMVGDFLDEDRRDCELDYRTKPAQIEATYAFCHTMTPWRRAQCIKEAIEQARHMKEEYEQCLTHATTSYIWNVYICCHNLPWSEFER